MSFLVGTWGSHSRTTHKTPTASSDPVSGTSTPQPHIQNKRLCSSSTQSVSTTQIHTRSSSVERRKSSATTLSDDTNSPSRKNVLWREAFRPRSKSDASKTKKPSIIANMKSAVQVCFPIFIIMQNIIFL